MLRVDDKQAKQLARLFGTYEDRACERFTLAAVAQYGRTALEIICRYVDETCFTLESNRQVWSVLTAVLERVESIDLPTFQSTADELGLGATYSQKANLDYLRCLWETPVNKDNVEY